MQTGTNQEQARSVQTGTNQEQARNNANRH